MKSCIFELVINVLTYAIKNKDEYFSQKDFKNVIYTQEFANFDINEKIAFGFEYLLKRGLIDLENNKLTYYEKYSLPKTLQIHIENDTKAIKDLSKNILLMHEGKEKIDTNEEVEDSYSEIIETIEFIHSSSLSEEDKDQLKVTLSKRLLSIDNSITSTYSLFTILQLLKLGSFIEIEIKNEDNCFFAKNVQFKYIEINTSSLSLHFNKCCFEINDISSVKSIKSIDETPLNESIDKSIEILNTYSDEKVENIIKHLKQMYEASV